MHLIFEKSAVFRGYAEREKFDGGFRAFGHIVFLPIFMYFKGSMAAIRPFSYL